MLIDLRILTGKKHPQIKLQCFRKVSIWKPWWLVHQTNSLCEVFKLKQSFWKNKVVTGKTQFFLIDPFCAPQPICLNISSWQSSFLMTNKKRYEVFWWQLKNAMTVFSKRFDFFRKFVSKFKYGKRSQFPVIFT